MSANFEDRVAERIGDGDAWLTPAEVSRIIGFTIRTLNTWRARRKGPPHVIISGRSVRYSAESLKTWMASEACGRRGGANA